LRVGESVKFDGGRIEVTLLEKSGQRARLDIRADKDVKIDTPKKAADVAKQGLTMK
jgi:sRNA-binding carbon storage regulator CsrA